MIKRNRSKPAFIIGLLLSSGLFLVGCVGENRELPDENKYYQAYNGELRIASKTGMVLLEDADNAARGRGIMLNREGRLLTAAHILEESEYSLSQNLGVEKIYTHPTYDVAIIKLDKGTYKDKNTTKNNCKNIQGIAGIEQNIFASNKAVNYGMSGLPVTDINGKIRGILVSKNTRNPQEAQAIMLTKNILTRINSMLPKGMECGTFKNI